MGNVMKRYEFTIDDVSEKTDMFNAAVDEIREEIRCGECEEFDEESFLNLLGDAEKEDSKIVEFLFMTLFRPLASVERMEKMRQSALDAVISIVDRRDVDIKIIADRLDRNAGDTYDSLYGE